MDTSVGVRIREIRQETGLTQKLFGQALGVSLPTINRIENSQRSPDAGLRCPCRADRSPAAYPDSAASSSDGV